jgi:hypothetical protein
VTQEDVCGPVHEELKEIFRQALRAKSAKERKRLQRQGLLKMWEAPRECFWLGEPPHYDNDLLYIEATYKAWDYIERKIHGDIRGKGTTEEKKYDPDKGDASPITLWNKRCKGQYRDLQSKQPPFVSIDARTGEAFDIEEVAQESSPPDIVEKVRQIIEEDAEGKYQNSYVRQTPPPPITIQDAMLEICRITACGEKWTLEKVARRFDISPGVMKGKPRQTIKLFFREIGEMIRA